MVLYRKILRYIKWTVNYVVNHIVYWFYRVKNQNKFTRSEHNKIIWIDFRTNLFRRRIASIVFWFNKAGYQVYLKDSFRFIGSMSFFDRLVFRHSVCKISIKKPKNIKLILTNKVKQTYEYNEVLVSNNYWVQDTKESWHLPEGMHPHIYYFNLIPKDLHIIRKNNNRKIGVFFSGNIDSDLYDWPVIEEKFQLLSRNKINNILKNEIDPAHIVIPQNERELYESVLNDKMVLNDRNKVMIDQAGYLEFLSNCEFYLFTPGVGFPLCHNNFESMAVGCIPITQYAHYHYPNLEHGNTCLVFNDEEDLVRQVNRALTMDKKEIKRMRKNVLKYYDRYLSEEAIVKNIEQKVLQEGTKKLLIL